MTSRSSRAGSSVFIWLVSIGGAAAVALSIRTLAGQPFEPEWLVLALCAWVSGYYSIKVPMVPAAVSLTEAFLFAQVLLFGAAPAVVTVALDGLWWSLRRQNRRWRRLLFNMSEPAVSLWVASAAASHLTGFAGVANEAVTLGSLALPASIVLATYVVMNTGLTAVAVSSDTCESPWRVWRGQMVGLLTLSHLACMSIALLLTLHLNPWDLRAVAIIVPLVVISNVAFKAWAERVEEGQRHLDDLTRLNKATVETLAMAIDAKDQVTHGHLRRVQTFTMELAAALGITDDLQLKALAAAGLLHDMGKLAVPDYILNKPGKLTPGEYEQIKLHAEVGAEILETVDFPYPVVPIVRHHHENWDGTGYPDGIAGEAIPLGARILAVIDCYDALTSDRPYRCALSNEEARGIILDRRGRMYDPRVVDCFLRIEPSLPRQTFGALPATRALTRIAASVGKQPHVQPSTATASADYTEFLLRWSDLAAAVRGHARVEEVGALAAQQLVRLFPDTLIVLWVQTPGMELRIAHAAGPWADALQDVVVPVGFGGSGWVAANRTPLVDGDARLDFGERVAHWAPPLETALSVPLLASDRTLGVLAMYRPKAARFSPEHAALVEFFAAQIAPALVNAGRTEQYQSTAYRHPITGLPNHKYLRHTIDAGRRSHLPSTAGMICIRYRQDQDPDRRPQVIAELAAAVRLVLRVTDLVFHSGPAELVVLVPNCDAATGTALQGRIASAAAGAGLPHLRVGLASAPADGADLLALLATARRRTSRAAEDPDPVMGLQRVPA